MSFIFGFCGTGGALWTGIAVSELVEGKHATLLGAGVGLWMFGVLVALAAIYDRLDNVRSGQA